MTGLAKYCKLRAKSTAMSSASFYDQTGWSTIDRLKSDDTKVREAARERLLTRYRRPIILEMQSRERCSALEAEELAHQFIHNALQRDFLSKADPARGRFR